MSCKTSAFTKCKYGLKRVCKVWEISRATAYRNARETQTNSMKRGPKPATSDLQLIEFIRKDIKDSPFQGEGHRKVHARLRLRKKIIVGRQRVLRLMREHRLLSPYRTIRGKAKKHDGRITTDKALEMWGTDGAKILTVKDGWVWFFGILEHWNAECLGWHVSKRGDRFAALEALNMAVKERYKSVNKQVACGLKLRMDHGSQFTSDHFLNQVRYLGIVPSMGYVKEPETNGVIERFHRTLKEQIIHGHVYETIGDLQKKVREFIEKYNKHWLLKKLGYLSPKEARVKWEQKPCAA